MAGEILKSVEKLKLTFLQQARHSRGALKNIFTTSIFNYSVPLTSVLSIFAEAINTESHLEQLKELGIEVEVDVDESVREIEKNLAWVQKKVPEISLWVKNEKGGASKLKFSIMIFIFSIILIVLQ